MLAGEDALAILATGAGKSLCYQLPALMLEGTTIVVSPLIALMKDQRDMLHQLGYHANTVAMNSTLDEAQESEALAQIAAGEMKIVFVTPEKLEDQSFIALLQRIRVPLFVVDEAHCISAVGARLPAGLLGSGLAIEALGRPPVLSLTATATPAVREDILTQLGIPERGSIVRGIRSSEPALRSAPGRERSREEQGAQELFSGPGASTAPASSTPRRSAARSTCRSSCTTQLDLPAAVYHSKLQKHDRIAVHELFMNEAIRAVVATNAFGLGIDKPNIRFVIHYDLPGSVEAYTQEAGRAGRDGEPSRCILVYRMSDTRVQNYFLTGKYPDVEEVQKVFATLEYFDAQKRRRFAGRPAQDLAAAADQAQSRAGAAQEGRASSKCAAARATASPRKPNAIRSWSSTCTTTKRRKRTTRANSR